MEELPDGQIIIVAHNEIEKYIADKVVELCPVSSDHVDDFLG